MKFEGRFCYLGCVVTKRDVATALKKLRGSRTQTAVARAAGIDKSVWNLYEKEQRMPTEKKYPLIAQGLGCTAYQLAFAIVQACLDRLAAAEDQTAKTGEETESDYPTQDDDELRFADVAEPPGDPLRREVRRHLRELFVHVEALLLLGRR